MGTHSKELPRRSRVISAAAALFAGTSLVTAAVVLPQILSHPTEHDKTTGLSSVKASPGLAGVIEKGIEPKNTTRRIESMGSTLFSYAQVAHQESALPVRISLGGKLISFTIKTKGGPTQYSVKYGKVTETEDGIVPVDSSITMLSETVPDGKGSQILVLNRMPERHEWDITEITSGDTGDNSEEDVLWKDDKASYDTEQYGQPTSITYKEKTVSSQFKYILRIIADNVGIAKRSEHMLQVHNPVSDTLVSYQTQPTDAYAAVI